MAPKDKSDFQTLNLFVILALLTVLFVSGLRLVLFAPTPPPVIEQEARR